MDVQARLVAWPEVPELLSAFQVRCRRPEGAAALARSLTGLLTELPNQNGETMVQAVPGPSAQRWPEFLPNRQGDEIVLNRQQVQKMTAEATTDEGVVVFDDTGFPTPGRASGGVARPYAGPRGQGGHGQSAGTCCDSDRQARWPVAGRRYLPKPWAHDPARRQQALGPMEVSFQTTPESALQRRDQARAWGGPIVVCSPRPMKGATPHVWAGLEARQERDVGAVRIDFQGTVGRAATTPVGRTDELRHSVPRWQGRTRRWGQGSQGWLRKKCVAVRGWRVTSDGQRHVGWRVGERASRGPLEERKFYWSTLPATAALEELAGYAPRR